MFLKKRNYSLKITRKVHRITAAYLFFSFIVLGISGLTLGWKKNSNGLILPEIKNGTSVNISNWLPTDSLQSIAFTALKEKKGSDIDLELDRIDMRPQKGILKFVFENHYWEVQLDGKSGKVLTICFRNSDLVEEIHDGSILDRIFGTPNEILKLIYVSILGSALLLFTITGIWLWFVKVRKS